MSAELAKYNVVAAFRDLELASEAVGALREAGYDESELSILGKHPDELDVVAEDAVGEPLAGGSGVAKQVIVGSAGAGGIGAVLGAAGGAAVAAIPGVGLAVGIGALLGAISTGLAGSTVGAIVEGESALRSDASWQQTFGAIKEGAIVVGVHAEDPDRVSEAAELLAGLDPMEVRRINDRGETVHAADEHA